PRAPFFFLLIGNIVDIATVVNTIFVCQPGRPVSNLHKGCTLGASYAPRPYGLSALPDQSGGLGSGHAFFRAGAPWHAPEHCDLACAGGAFEPGATAADRYRPDHQYRSLDHVAPGHALGAYGSCQPDALDQKQSRRGGRPDPEG